MNIRSKLRINAVLPVALVLLTATVLVLTARYVNNISARERTANAIVKEVFELTIITDEYLLHRGSRAVYQWRLKYDALGKLLEQINFDEPGEQIILDRIRQEHKGIQTTFNELLSNHETLAKYEPAGDSRESGTRGAKGVRRTTGETAAATQTYVTHASKQLAIQRELGNRIVGQLISKSQAMVSGGLQLANISQAQMTAAEKWADLIIMGFVLILGSLNAMTSVLINRSVVRPIAKVTDATEVIAGGNLEHRIGIQSNDEIGTLSRTFDRMMDRLKETTASRDELNRTNEQLKNSTAQLIQAEKMASIGQMVAGVAHEINTPLAYVRSSIEIVEDQVEEVRKVVSAHEKLMQLLRSSEDDEAISEQFNVATEVSAAFNEQRYLDEMQTLLTRGVHGLDQIRELVLNMKNFSRLDREKVTEYSLNEGLDSVLLLATPVLKNRIKVIKDYNQIPAVSCSPSQINQVFLNVITNAAQAIEGDGTIWIETGVVGEQVRVQIRDNGRGIPQDSIKKIFDPFFTTKKVGEGTGLGLSIAHKIMEEHGGDIEVHSVVGEGSTVSVTLPANGEVQKRLSA